MKSIKSKKLVISRETLRQLSDAQLDAVAGGTFLCPIETTTVAVRTRPGLTQCGTTSVGCAVLPPSLPFGTGNLGLSKP